MRCRELTLLEPESRFGDKPFKFQVVFPQNGTAVLKGFKQSQGASNIFMYLVGIHQGIGDTNTSLRY